MVYEINIPFIYQFNSSATAPSWNQGAGHDSIDPDLSMHGTKGDQQKLEI